MLNRLFHYSSYGFIAVSLCLTAACTDKPVTSLIVLVDTDMDIPNDLDEIHINGVNTKGEQSRVIEFKLRAETENREAYTLPLSFEVQPQNADSLKGDFGLYIKARRNGKDLFERSVRTQYVEGKRKLLPIFLAHRCVGESEICANEEPKQTCGQEGCESPLVDSSQLSDYESDSGDPSFSFPQSATPPTPGVEITITPTVAYHDSKEISCSFSGVTALNEAPVTYHARWVGPEPYDDPEFTKNVLPGSMILFPDDTFTKQKRETWACEVKSIANDVEQLSRQSITIADKPPEITAPVTIFADEFDNDSASVNSTFSCTLPFVSDSDNDSIYVVAHFEYRAPGSDTYTHLAFRNETYSFIELPSHSVEIELDSRQINQRIPINAEVRCTLRFTPSLEQSDTVLANLVSFNELTYRNTPPQVSQVVLTPSSPNTTTDLTATVTASDVDGHEFTYDYVWQINMETPIQRRGIASPMDTLDSSLFSRGDSVRVKVTPSDQFGGIGEETQTELTIGNTPPSITAVTLSPASPQATDSVTASVTGWFDADGDPPSYRYEWVYMPPASATSTVVTFLEPRIATDEMNPEWTTLEFRKGGQLVVRVTPDDDQGGLGAVRTATAIYLNTPPSVPILDLQPSSPRVTDLLVVNAVSSDNDQDPVTFRYEWLNDGSAPSSCITNTSSLANGPNFASPGFSRCQGFVKNDPVSVTVTPNDGEIDGQSRTITVTIVNSAPSFASSTSTFTPSLSLQGDDSALNQETTFTCQLVDAILVDPDVNDTPQIEYEWHIARPDGQAVTAVIENQTVSETITITGSDPRIRSNVFSGAEIWCEARPVDSESTYGSRLVSNRIRLLDNPVTIRSIQAPTYVFTSTGPGQSSQVNCEVEYQDPDIGQIVEGQISWTHYGQFLNERIQTDSTTSTSAATPQTFSSTLDTLGQPPGSYKCYATFTSTNSVAGSSPIVGGRASSYKYTHLINYGPRNDIADRSLIAFFPFDSEFESDSQVKEFIRSQTLNTEPCASSGNASTFSERHIVGGQIDSAKDMNACPHKLVSTQSPFDDLSEVTVCGWVSVPETYDLSTSDVEGLISVYSSTVSPPKMTDLRGFEFGLTGSQSSSTLIQPYFSLQTSPVGFALGQTRSYVRRSLDSTHGTARTGFFPSSSSAALEDRWTHLCARYDGYTISAWMDGFKIIEEDFRGGILGFENQYIATSTTSEMGRRNGRTFLLVGAGWGSTDPFRGAMDNFKVWNRALSPTEICDDSGSELCVQWVWSEPAQVFFSRNEITVGQFQNWVNTCDPNDSNFVCSQPMQYRTYTELADCNFGRISSSGSPPADRLAMNCVNSDEAYNFCKRQDDGADVLFQEEWRLEARASHGSATQTYPWGNQAPSCDYAIMSDPNGGTFPGCVNDPADSHPGEVCSGSRPLSHSGLCNMGGNVSEWFHDAATASYGTIGGAYTSFAPSDFLSTQSSLTLLTDDREPEQGIRCMKVPKGRIYSTNPARSCRQIFSQRPDAPHGSYEIKFQNNTTLLPPPYGQAHCQMGRYGGMTWLLNSAGDGHLMQNEVTVDEYQRCVDDGACHVASGAQLAYSDNPQCNFGDPARDKHPMNCLTTAAAVEFCEWAAPSSQGSGPGRLPLVTEFEQEMSNYDSSTSAYIETFPWGEDAPSCSTAWLTDPLSLSACARSAMAPATIQSCSLPAGYNQNHLCDLIGNVAEFAIGGPALLDYFAAGKSFKDAFDFPTSELYIPLSSSTELQPPNTPSLGFRCARTGPLWD